ncbi:unnamed protein product [Urochloa decumbens]|uniref:F-box domain-containing protein n=1 Tax=Urochloa decumbens TaxID=240449 RepID=A0ABC8XUT6_9POAL
MELPMPPPPPANGSSRKRKSSSAGGLGDLHDDMLERVLARLPPSSYSRLRAVCRRWRAAAASPTFLHACARVPSRDPWFLMLSAASGPAVAFDAAESAWTRTRSAAAAAPGSSVPVAASGGLVLYRAPRHRRPLRHQPLLAVAMYGAAPYRVAIFTGDLPDLSMAVFDSSTNSWSPPVPLARRMPNDASCPAAAAAAGDDDDDGTVYFLSKSGDVVSTNMQRSASKQYSSAVVPSPADGAAVAYFLSNSGTVVACDTARREYSELPRILPAYSEYSVDVVACGGAAYAVVLAEYLDTASLRVWEFAGAGAGEWRQVAAMPPAMSHGFRGRHADINCVGHGDRLMVCVSSGDGGGGGCFMCDVATNRWEELPEHVDGDGEVSEFLAAFSFEPRVEITV